MRLFFVLLLLIAALPGKAFAGHEIEGSFKGDGTHPSALPVRGETSAGFASKYVFRGTNLAPHSDGVIWSEGTISVSPWANGTFSLGFWAGSQIGTARFSTNATGSSRTPREATDFTARNLSYFRFFAHPNGPFILDTREVDKDFLGNLFSDSFTGSGGVRLNDVYAYLERAYVRLATERGRLFPLLGVTSRQPIFPVDPVTGERSRTLRSALRGIGLSNNGEGFLRASGYRGPLPDQITKLERDLKVTQREFHEFRIPFSYEHELGPVSISIANTFYYAEQELIYEDFREHFASDEARRLIDFASRNDIYVGRHSNTSARGWDPQVLAPMLPIRPGHPEDFLSNGSKKTSMRRVTAKEIYDRVDLELSTNSQWLWDKGYTWARYLRPRATYSRTLFSDVDTSDVLPGYSSAEHGSYLALELDGHIPLLAEKSKGDTNVRLSSRRSFPVRDKLSLDMAALVSASFGDRTSGAGEPVRGWHDFEMKAEVNWWMTPWCRVAPNINYYTLISEPVSGTERSAFWYGLTCEMCF